MRVDISTGEAFDKYSILEIKAECITDEIKRNDVIRELNTLHSVRSIIDGNPLLYSALLDINRTIWDLTDTVKRLKHTEAEYARVSHDIFNENQKRFRIKNMINHLESSDIREQKSYEESHVVVHVTDVNVAVPLIWNLSFLYDSVSVSGDYTNILKPMFRSPNFRFTSIQNAPFDVTFPVYKHIGHSPSAIRYASGGRLGDFIHQLSVVFEKYLQTGRKGVIYIGGADVGGDTFTNGLADTMSELLPVLSNLPCIESVEPYTGQSFDINLSVWRSTPNLYSKSWQEVFGDMYNVHWGQHAWLTSVIRSDLVGVTLISSSPTRWPDSIQWSEFFKTLPGTLMFLRITGDDYTHFSGKTDTKLPYIDAKTLSEIVIAIHSCHTFVGTLSMPLAVADALKKQRIALTQANTADESIAIRTNPNYVNH